MEGGSGATDGEWKGVASNDDNEGWACSYRGRSKGGATEDEGGVGGATEDEGGVGGAIEGKGGVGLQRAKGGWGYRGHGRSVASEGEGEVTLQRVGLQRAREG